MRIVLRVTFISLGYNVRVSKLKLLLKISRPRFWIYVFGPFLIGLAAAAKDRSDFIGLEALVFALYFLFPANLLIYGINDIFDYETDKRNPKKRDYETLVNPGQRKEILFYIGLLNLPFVLLSIVIFDASTIALFAFLFFSVFYSAPPIRAKTKPFLDSAFNVEFPPGASYVSLASVVLLFVPTAVISAFWLGKRDAILLLCLLGLYAFIIESIALATGFPYGSFSYTELIGPRIFGATPLALFVSWTPLLLAAYSVAANAFYNPWARVGVTTIVLVVFDFVLDPGAVYLKFWSYSEGGWYYGVPWSNYLGWVISGLVGAGLLEFILHRLRPLLPVPIQLIYTAFLTLYLWTWISFFAGLLIPGVIGCAVLALLTLIFAGKYYAFDDMVVIVDENNNPLSTERKLAAHHDNTPLHRAFSVFLFNPNGELLLQRRADHKKTWGGIWSNSCCGHVMLHEKVPAAAERRLKYELGIEGVDPRTILPEFRYRAEKDGVVENEICPVLVGLVSDDPRINPDEVSDFKWVDWDHFLTEISVPENGFSPWCVEEANLLAKNEEFRTFFTNNCSPS